MEVKVKGWIKKGRDTVFTFSLSCLSPLDIVPFPAFFFLPFYRVIFRPTCGHIARYCIMQLLQDQAS